MGHNKKKKKIRNQRVDGFIVFLILKRVQHRTVPQINAS